MPLTSRWFVTAALLLAGFTVSVEAADSYLERPLEELFGVHTGYGYVGSGIATATGNFVRNEVDLPSRSGLLSWGRTYNSLDNRSTGLGPSWSTRFSSSLRVNSDDSVTFTGDDGRNATFEPDGAGGYRRPPDVSADLTQATTGEFNLNYLSGPVWTFDAQGRGLRRTFNGQDVQLSYDPQDRLATVVDSNGATLTFERNDDGLITHVSTSDGRSVTYSYTDGVLTSVVGPAGTTGYESSADQVIHSVTVNGQVRVRNDYDESGRVVHQAMADGSELDLRFDSFGDTEVSLSGSTQSLTLSQDSAGHLVLTRNEAGDTLEQLFDEQGRIVAATTPGLVRIEFDYDAAGRLTSKSVGGAATRFAYDDQGRVTEVTDPTGSVMHYGYEGGERVPSSATDPTDATTTYVVSSGLVLSRTDPNGAITTYEYDDTRQPVSVTDPLGRTSRLDYNALGQLIKLTSPLGNTYSYEYDDSGRVTQVTDPLNASTKIRYSIQGTISDIENPLGAITHYTFDPAGNPLSMTDPLERKTSYTYGPDGTLSGMTSPTGGDSVFTHDSLGRPVTISDPIGTTISYAYNSDHRSVRRTDESGTTVTRYDQYGNPTATRDALGRTTHYEYNASGDLLSITDPTGAIWRNVYDTAHRIVSTTDPLGAVTRYGYDKAGHLVSITDPLDQVRRYVYDDAGNLIKVIDPLGGMTRYTYDADDRRISWTTPAGLQTRYAYDKASRVSTVVDPRGGETRYIYDANGQVISTTHPSGAVERIDYDAAGQVSSVTNALGHTTRYTYDGNGRLLTIVEPNGATTRYTYDAAGRQTSSADPLDRVTTQQFDATGNLLSVTQPDGATLSMTYDAAGQLLTRQAEDGSMVTYTYDAAGRQTRMTDTTGTTQYTYDAAGRLSSYSVPGHGKFSIGRNLNGQPTLLTYPDGLVVDYRYDAASQLVGLSDSRGRDVSYQLDPDGRLLKESLPDHWARRYRYAGGLLSEYKETHGWKVTQDAALTRDADGRIIKQCEPGHTLEFGYDAAGQLVKVSGPWCPMMSLEYDENGNRTVIQRAGITATMTYDEADELVRVSEGHRQIDYTYDSVGRLLTRTEHVPGQDLTFNTESLSYDGFGNLVEKIATQGCRTQTATSTFTGNGLPAEINVRFEMNTPFKDRLGVYLPLHGCPNHPLNSVTRQFAWSAGESVTQILSEKTEGVDFLYGYGRTAVSAWDNRDRKDGYGVFSRDVNGSTLRTEQTRSWARANSYDVFGASLDIHDTLDVPAFGYRGELTSDDSVFLRARNYDTRIGRFTSRDPVTSRIGQVQPRSPYVYGGNDPVNQTDPLGKYSLSSIFSSLTSALNALHSGNPFGDCPDSGNSLHRHSKCFQGEGPLRTRGFYMDVCLRDYPGSEPCLSGLWFAHQPERAAQAFTITELNRKRRGWISRAIGTTNIQKTVDWEVGFSDNLNPGEETGFQGFRLDIVTDEKNIYEVKRYAGPATTTEVTDQLNRYIRDGKTWFGIEFVPGSELQEWEDTFVVYDGSTWDFLTGGTTVFVWGEFNPPGHVYFSEKRDKVPPEVRAEIWRNEQNEALRNFLGIPVPIPVSVPVP